MIGGAINQARSRGLPAILTERDWYETRRQFDDMCAYCQVEPMKVVEHFVSLRDGGGTMASNCLPACRSCNTSKGAARDPVEWVRRRFGSTRCAEVRGHLRRRAGRDAKKLAGIAQAVAAKTIVDAALAWASRSTTEKADDLRRAVRAFKKIRVGSP